MQPDYKLHIEMSIFICQIIIAELLVILFDHFL